jgi:transcriptional regulator with XRE-family HTH domain
MPNRRFADKEGLPVKKLGELMRSQRERRGMSQEKVAKIMGISGAYLSQMENAGRRIYWNRWTKWCSALGISPPYAIDQWMKMGAFDEMDGERRKEYHDIIDQMIECKKYPELDGMNTCFKGLIRSEGEARRKSERVDIAKGEKPKFSEEEFVVRAIEKLRKPPHKGIHTVYSGFNDAWRKHFGTDPIEGVQNLAQQSKIEIRPAKKGGAIIYLPGENPGPKNVLDLILE